MSSSVPVTPAPWAAEVLDSLVQLKIGNCSEGEIILVCIRQPSHLEAETIFPELEHRLEQLTCRSAGTADSWSKSFFVRGNQAAAKADETKLRRLLEHGAVLASNAFKGGMLYFSVVFEDMEVVIFMY